MLETIRFQGILRIRELPEVALQAGLRFTSKRKSGTIGLEILFGSGGAGDTPEPEHNLSRLNWRSCYGYSTLFSSLLQIPLCPPDEWRTRMPPRKGTPEYDDWKNSPAYEVYRQKHIGRPLSEKAKAKLSKANAGKKLSPEQKAKISASLKGHPVSEETRAKLVGHPVSEETRRKISEANHNRKPFTRKSTKGFRHSEETRAKMSASHKAMSDETRQKMSEATKGRKLSEETKEKLRIINTGRKGKSPSPETRAKLSAAHKGRRDHRKGIRLNITPEDRQKRSDVVKARWANLNEKDREHYLNLLVYKKGNANTGIEQIVAAQLDAQSIVYETQKHIRCYVVDFYIPSENKVIEVNGCYWHSCEQCGIVGKKGIEIRDKDAKRYKTLREKGYEVEVIWEHDLRKVYKKEDTSG